MMHRGSGESSCAFGLALTLNLSHDFPNFLTRQHLLLFQRTGDRPYRVPFLPHQTSSLFPASIGESVHFLFCLRNRFKQLAECGNVFSHLNPAH